MKKYIFLCLFSSFVLVNTTSRAQSEVTFYTSMGTFVVKTYDTLQPITAGNFLSLVYQKFYDGIIFHRVVSGFVIQGGDPTGTGYGGPGYTIPDEFDPNTSNVQKAVAMANAGPNTGGSQFFINLVNNLNLNANYPVFGIVINNFSVVQAIGNVPVDNNDKPLTDVVMDSLRVTYVYPNSVKEYEKAFADLELYPNPVEAGTVVGITLKAAKRVALCVYDQQGRMLYSADEELQAGFNALPFTPYHQLAPGIYQLTVSDGSGISAKKFVVNR